MIKKKDIDIKAITKSSFNAALKQHGLLNEAGKKEKPYEVKGELTAVNIKFEPRDWEDKDYSPTPEDLSYFTNKIREIAGIKGRQVTISDFDNIINTLNRILGFKVDPTRGIAIQSGTGANNVNEVVTALYVSSVINTIITKFSSQAAGFVWENFIANLLLGTIPPRGKVLPIQDVVDEAGNYVSLKLLKENEMEGSKLNLAIGITKAKGGKVIYLVAHKSSDDDPFKVDFYSFEISKENYFNFICNQENVFDESDLTGTAKEYAEKIVKESTPKKVTKATKLPPLPQENYTIDSLYIEKFKEENPDGDVQKFIFSKKQEFKEKIQDKAEEFTRNPQVLNNYRKLFESFVNLQDGKITIKFPGQVGPEGKKSEKYTKTLDLSSPKGFTDSMIDFWLWPDRVADKIFKPSAYHEFVSKLIGEKLPFIDFEIGELDEQQTLKFINSYNNLTVDEKSAENIAKLQKNLNVKINRIIENSQITIAEKQKLFKKFFNRPFEAVVKEALSIKKTDPEVLQQILKSVKENFSLRKESYRNIHESITDELLKLFAPFIEWYEMETGQQTKITKAKTAQKVAATKSAYKESELVKKFWDIVATMSPEEETLNEGLLTEGGPSPSETRFRISKRKMQDVGVSEFTEYQPLIISKIQAKSIASTNVNMFKTYVEPYNLAYKKISYGTNRYFVNDEIDGLTEVNKGIEELQEAMKKFQGTTGKIKKASELTEVLNMTREAVIVMELLQKLEE